MKTVAIHQPNYLPWLGYFYKIKQADHFVFLDDVQYSKGSYVNRVQISSPSGPKWLTVPVTFHFGDLITQVEISKASWTSSHLDLLRNTYKNAQFFRQVWQEIEEMYQAVAGKQMHEGNMFFIRSIASKLGLDAQFHVSSAFGIDEKSDERLVSIVKAISPTGTYLSGKGGLKYQDETKFTEAGLQLRYLNFNHPRYNQGKVDFDAGLSVLDALFHLGWDGCTELLSMDNSP